MLESKYDDSVFINCPFTADYVPLFRGIVFAVMDSGFAPRSALENSDSTEQRIEKLYALIRKCRFGIHDLSATDLDATHGLPRFNMPLELGIFLGARRYGDARQRLKSGLILDTERYRYQKFCSDLAGHDPRAHGGKVETAIVAVRDWLRGARPQERLPGGERMADRYRMFSRSLPTLADSLKLDSQSLSFLDLLLVIEAWLEPNPW